MNISGLQKLVSPDVGRVETRNMIEDLNEGSQYLADQKDRLKNMWPQLKAKIVSFYETRTTRTVTEVGFPTYSLYKSLGVLVNLIGWTREVC